MKRREPMDGWNEWFGTRVAGATHGEFRNDLHLLEHGLILTLVREPKNPHDPNAVRIDLDGKKVGYIPSTQAPIINKLLHLGYPVIASVDVVDKAQRLVLIELAIRAWGDGP